MRDWEAVFFDFDGVVLDSVDIKTQSFAALYREYGPEVEARVVAHHLANGGVSRFEKLRHYHASFLNRPLDDAALAALCARFAGLVVEKVLAAPFIPGALETLEQLKAENIDAHIVSGTPQDELQKIVGSRNLAQYFGEVHGSPRSKTEILQDILARRGYRPGACLFLGDALSDLEAALRNGLAFLGIIQKDAAPLFPEGVSTSPRVFLPQRP